MPPKTPKSLNVPSRHISFRNTISEDHIQQRPHSSLNLVTRSKISPSIYKFRHNSTNRLGIKEELNDNPENGKTHFYLFISATFRDLFERGYLHITDKNKKGKEVYNQHCKKFPKRSAYSRVQQRPQKFEEESPNKQTLKSTLFDGDVLVAKTLQPKKNENSFSRGQYRKNLVKYNPKRLILNESKLSDSQPSERHNQRLKSSNERFSPWDLYSGFGKRKRF